MSDEGAVGTGTARGTAGSASTTVLLTLATAQFLMTLDSSVMNVSIATVADDVGTTVTGIQTAITLYTLVMASLMITGGKIGQILGRKRAFAIGCVIYAVGSSLTALAQNLTVLIIGWSFLEGIGAALIMPAIVALVASNFGRAERPRAYGLVAASGAIAVAAGPLIGGLLTTYASWRWVFAGEVLIVAGILLLTGRIADTEPDRDAHLDLVGTGLSALGLGLIVIGVLQGGAWGFVNPKPGAPEWLGLSPVIWLVLLGGLVLRGFLAWERHRLRRGASALVDPAMLENRLLRGGLTSFFFQYLLQAGLFFTIPLFLSVALGLSAVATGVRLLPLSVALLVTAVGVPKLLPDASPRRVVRVGFACLFVGIVVLVAALDVGAGAEVTTLPMLLVGVGVGALASQLGQRHRLGGPRRAERRGGRPPEHRHQPRGVPRHGARRRGADLGADQLVLHRHRVEPRHPERPGLAGAGRAGQRGAVRPRRRPREGPRRRRRELVGGRRGGEGEHRGAARRPPGGPRPAGADVAGRALPVLGHPDPAARLDLPTRPPDLRHRGRDVTWRSPPDLRQRSRKVTWRSRADSRRRSRWAAVGWRAWLA